MSPSLTRRGATELITKPCPLAARICCTLRPTSFSSVRAFSSVYRLVTTSLRPIIPLSLPDPRVTISSSTAFSSVQFRAGLNSACVVTPQVNLYSVFSLSPPPSLSLCLSHTHTHTLSLSVCVCVFTVTLSSLQFTTYKPITRGAVTRVMPAAQMQSFIFISRTYLNIFGNNQPARPMSRLTYTVSRAVTVGSNRCCKCTRVAIQRPIPLQVAG